MLFKVIDPSFVLSEAFRNWSPATCKVYTICVALANVQTGEFYHKSETIADYANLEESTVRKCLLRMAAAGVIKIAGSARKRYFRYPFAVVVSSRKRRPIQIPEEAHQPVNSPEEAHQPVKEAHQPVSNRKVQAEALVSVGSAEIRKSSNNRDLTKGFKTTTEVLFSASLLQELQDRYGRDLVVGRAALISSMPGVRNPAGLLRDSLEKNYSPTNGELRAHQSVGKARAAREAESLRRDELYGKMVADYEASDPAIAEAALEKIMNL